MCRASNYHDGPFSCLHWVHSWSPANDFQISSPSILMCLLHRTLAWWLEQVKDLSCWAVAGLPCPKVGLLFILCHAAEHVYTSQGLFLAQKCPVWVWHQVGVHSSCFRNWQCRVQLSPAKPRVCLLTSFSSGNGKGSVLGCEWNIHFLMQQWGTKRIGLAKELNHFRLPFLGKSKSYLQL